MNQSLYRVVAALFALTFIVAACASDTGAEWTYAPVTASQSQAPGPSEATAAPGGAAETPAEPAAAETTAGPEAPAEPAAVSGEPRVIQLQADAALRFTDTSGQPVSDIPVTPGETIIFEVDNTAGFEHNFWIGTDDQLTAPYATTDVGIDTWTTGVESVEWVVPADVSGLKFGCTVPGHYFTMQGTFSASEPAAAAEAPAEAPAAETTEAPEAPAEPAAVSGDSRVIQLQADAALRFTDTNGQPVSDIPVTPGETIIFEVDNTAGFEHDFWIGTDAELSTPYAETDVGIEPWTTGVQSVEWVVPADVSGLKFGCSVPGHYTTMQGTFSASEPAAAEATAAPEPAAAETMAAHEPAAVSGEPRVIELEADAAIRFLQDGEQIREIPVTPGETVVFRINNTAGFGHNFWIGPDPELQVPNGSTDTGLPDWSSGVQELEWVVPDDVTDLRFACTVPGHYFTMQGDFTVSQ